MVLRFITFRLLWRQTLTVWAWAGQINLDVRGFSGRSYALGVSKNERNLFFKDFRVSQILSFQPRFHSGQAIIGSATVNQYCKKKKYIYIFLQLIPDEENVPYSGFWHDERWSLDYQTGSFNPASPLSIGSKAPSHLILSDSSSVSGCLLRTHREWSGTVKEESMECFWRDRWKPKCQTPDWRGELTERWWTMREAVCLAKKEGLTLCIEEL